jgi:hypothetical protein
VRQVFDLRLDCCYQKMAVKHCIPRILEERCRHFFESRWPTESPLEINPYKLRVLTRLGQGTCLKIFNDLYYVPDAGVMDTLCEYFDLQPGDFLYYEKVDRRSDATPRQIVSRVA